MNYAEISKDIIDHLYASYEALKHSPLDPSLRIVLELRVSQMNACIYCCNLHTDKARQRNINELKLAALHQWHNSPLFSPAEKEALSWAESLTTLSNKRAVTDTKLAIHFTEREIVDITACVAIMNALNRMTWLKTVAACQIMSHVTQQSDTSTIN